MWGLEPSPAAASYMPKNYRGQSERIKLVDALRLGPDIALLSRRLRADLEVPRGVRIWLVVLLFICCLRLTQYQIASP